MEVAEEVEGGMWPMFAYLKKQKMTIPESNCLRFGFTYFPRKVVFGEVTFVLVLVVRE